MECRHAHNDTKNNRSKPRRIPAPLDENTNRTGTRLLRSHRGKRSQKAFARCRENREAMRSISSRRCSPIHRLPPFARRWGINAMSTDQSNFNPQPEPNPQLALTRLWMSCGPRARRDFLSDVRAANPDLWRDTEATFVAQRLEEMKGRKQP